MVCASWRIAVVCKACSLDRYAELLVRRYDYSQSPEMVGHQQSLRRAAHTASEVDQRIARERKTRVSVERPREEWMSHFCSLFSAPSCAFVTRSLHNPSEVAHVLFQPCWSPMVPLMCNIRPCLLLISLGLIPSIEIVWRDLGFQQQFSIR